MKLGPTPFQKVQDLTQMILPIALPILVIVGLTTVCGQIHMSMLVPTPAARARS